jgi:hypothetical protein
VPGSIPPLGGPTEGPRRTSEGPPGEPIGEGRAGQCYEMGSLKRPEVCYKCLIFPKLSVKPKNFSLDRSFVYKQTHCITIFIYSGGYSEALKGAKRLNKNGSIMGQLEND